MILSLGEPAIAQMQRSMTFDASTSLLIREFTAMLVQNDDAIQVEMRMGGHAPGTNPSETEQLQRGDIILMINGERTRSIEQMREVYEAIPDDEEIKIGVRRGDQRFIVRAKKGDVPEAGPGQMVLTLDGNSDNPPTIVPEFGMVLSNNENRIVVQAVLDQIMPDQLKQNDLMGYQIESINGETFENAAAVKTFVDTIEVGAQVELVIEKDGAVKTISFAKPEAQTTMSFSTNN